MSSGPPPHSRMRLLASTDSKASPSTQRAGVSARPPQVGLIVDDLGPNREMLVDGKQVINFGSDSFLGLDQDIRIQDAIRRGVRKWGTHNGASRMFSSVRSRTSWPSRSFAQWLAARGRCVVIYPSVTLANMGAIPAWVAKQGPAHPSTNTLHTTRMQEGAADRPGERHPARLLHAFRSRRSMLLAEAARALYRIAPFVCIDGVYSMSGTLPPLAELNTC